MNQETMNQETMKRAIELAQQYCIQLGIHVAITPTGRVVEKDLNGNCPIGRTAAALATSITQGHDRRLFAELAKWARAAQHAQSIESRPIGDILADVDAVLAGEGES